jgi:ribose transport system ATP-binding protein
VSALLQLAGLSKAYAAPVLSDIHLAVNAGEVLALTGENGAGKSTLSKIIAGLVSADAGTMELAGQPYAPTNRSQAEARGVRMVLQELSLIGTLSVAENLQLGQIPARAGFISRQPLAQRARAQLERVGLATLDPEQPVSALGIGQQQLLEIARGLDSTHSGGKLQLLILDEPTAMLSTRETATLFEQIALLTAQGVAIIYISHRLDELVHIADRVVVLRDGQLVYDQSEGRLEPQRIVQAMVGKELTVAQPRAARRKGAEVLRVAGLSLTPWVTNINLTLYAGQIVGVAGLVGSGRTQLLRLIYGADRMENGNIYVGGTTAVARIHSPSAAVAHGIGLLTEDRKAEGLLLSQSLASNLTIADLRAVSLAGWIRRAAETRVFERWSQRLRIRARDGLQRVDELSGGNQQKVVLARWLHRDCRVLLLDEPTRGVDVGARADIYAELDALAEAGKALLVVSSDLRELMMLCDRIAVLSAGRLAGVFLRESWSEEVLLEAAFSAYARSEAHSA